MAGSFCMSFINRWLKANKDKSLLDIITVCDLTYAITIIKNHKPVWEIDHLKEALGEIDQDRFNNYKEIEEPEERDKYAPKITRFSARIGAKRTFGSVIWNKEGMTFYESTTQTWKAAFRDDNTWEWICNGWITWLQKNNSGTHWQKRRG